MAISLSSNHVLYASRFRFLPNPHPASPFSQPSRPHCLRPLPAVPVHMAPIECEDFYWERYDPDQVPALNHSLGFPCESGGSVPGLAREAYRVAVDPTMIIWNGVPEKSHWPVIGSKAFSEGKHFWRCGIGACG